MICVVFLLTDGTDYTESLSTADFPPVLSRARLKSVKSVKICERIMLKVLDTDYFLLTDGITQILGSLFHRFTHTVGILKSKARSSLGAS